MRRVLVITYYWPPNGGAAVQRWLKMVKYLPDHGWAPVVYTPENPEVILPDPGLEGQVSTGVEVVRRPISEPYTWYKWLTGRKADERVHLGFIKEEGRGGGWREDLAVWVRGNAFIPDARVWWVRPSVRFLVKYLADHPVDAVVTTGPPHSMHLIGLALKKRTGVRWIADWRDPWTNIDFYRQLKLTGAADRKHHRLEREVVTHTDVNVAVGWTMAAELDALGSRRTEVVTNGFDPADVPSPPMPLDEAYSLVHVGNMTASRDIPQLWSALAALCQEDPAFAQRFTLRFIGPVDQAVLGSLAKAGLADKVERLGSVDHAQAMRHMQRARVLLLSVNDTPNAKGVLTSKLFEYLAMGRPILAVGPADGDVARVLGAPHLLVPREGISVDRAALRALFSAPASGGADSAWSRPALAGRMAAILGSAG